MAICTKCHEDKSVEEFGPGQKRKHVLKDGTIKIYQYPDKQCKDCKRAYHKAYYEREKDNGKWNLYSRKNGLKRRYGITEEDYAVLLEAQEGKCAICGGAQGRMHTATGEPRHLAVDHDHETNDIRGLLCDACNQGIGLFKDDPDRLLAAALYLLSSVKENA